MLLTVRFGIDEGTFSGSKMAISRNGSPWKLVRPAQATMSETLEFGNTYVLSFDKQGYVSKQVSINTANVPAGVKSAGLNLTVSVELGKVGASGVGQPIINYVYDEASKGFVMQKPKVDPESFKTALSDEEARKQAEATFALITQGEEKERQYKSHFTKEDALEGRKGTGSSKKEEETEEQRQAEEERKAAAIREADRQRAERLAKIEEQRKQIQSESQQREQENLTKREEQQRKQIAEMKEKEAERKLQEQKAAEEARVARAAEEQERREREAAAKAAFEEEQRRKEEAAAKADLERRKREAREKFEQEQRSKPKAPVKAEAEKQMSIEEAGNIVSRSEEIIQEEKRVIKQITIKRERHTFVYRMVKYDWGGVYYFKNDMDITRNDFDMETALEK